MNHRLSSPRAAPRFPVRSLVVAIALAWSAQASAAPVTVDLPPQPLAEAIKSLARQAGITIAADDTLLTGKQSPAVQGAMEPAEALRRLLAGSGLEAVSNDGTWRLRNLPAPAPAAPASAAQASPVTALPAVTVLGSRDPNVPLSNVPASISVVPREEIARQQPTAQRIEDILARTVPGFNPTNVGVRQIRGRTAQVFINGVPSNEQMRASAGSDINLLSPDQVDLIEVARGANSAYGFGSPGGIIALSSPRAESEQLTLRTRAGTSFNTSKPGGSFQSSVYQSVSQILGDFDFHAGLSYRKDGLARDKDGKPAFDFNSPALLSMGHESLYDFDTSLGYKLGGSGSLRLTITAGRMDVDERWESDGTGVYRQTDSQLVHRPVGDRNGRRHHTLNLSYENANLGGSAVKLEAVTSRAHADQYSTAGAVTQRDEQDNRYAGLRSSVTTPLDGLRQGATVSYGLDYMRNSYFRPVYDDDTGATIRFFSPDVTVETWAPYAQGQVPVGDWRFNAGARHERYGGSVETGVGTGGIQGGDIRSFRLTLFNAGVVYVLRPGHDLYASFSQGAEISQVGRAATTAVTADRVDPQPAKSNQYELGLRQRTGGLDYTAAVFYTTSDLMSSLDCSVPLEPCRPLREPRKFWGVEGTVAWRIDASTGVGGTLGWMDGRRTLATGEKRRTGSNETPPLLLGAYVDFAPQAGWSNRLQFDYRAGRDPFGDSTAYPEGKVDSLFLAHVSTSVDVGPGQLQIGVRNLFDKRYYSLASEAGNGGFNWIPEQGRRVSISYAMKW